MEVAMRLLEKDTHEKQDTLAALRLQLDQVKTLNLQMFHKAQVDTHQHTLSSSDRKPVLKQFVLLLRTRNERQKKSRRRLYSLRRRWMKWRRQ